MKVLRWLDDNLEKVILCIILAMISVLMFVQIILRTAFSSSLAWSDEACRYLFVWTGAIGISYATKNGSHLRMDILPTLVPGLKKPLSVLCDITLGIVAVMLVLGSAPFFESLAKTGQVSAALRLPMKYLYGSMLVGFGLTLFRLIQKYVLIFLGVKKHESEDGGIPL